MCYEAVLLAEDNSTSGGGGGGGGDGDKCVGFIALSAYGKDCSETSASISAASAALEAGRMLTGAQVDRLCVLPGYRGAGVKEALLRVADGQGPLNNAFLSAQLKHF